MYCDVLKKLMEDNISLLGLDSNNNTCKIAVLPDESDESTVNFKSGDLVKVNYEGKWVKALYICPSRLTNYHFCICTDYEHLRNSQYRANAFHIWHIKN